MIVACAACGTQLEVDESLIPAEGGVTHCAHCQAEVPLQRPGLSAASPAAPPSSGPDLFALGGADAPLPPADSFVAEQTVGVQHDFMPGPSLELAGNFPTAKSSMDFDLAPPAPKLSGPIGQDYGASELNFAATEPIDPEEPEFVEVDEVLPSFTGSLSTDGSVEKAPVAPSAMADFPPMPEPVLDVVSAHSTSKQAHERTTVRTDVQQATGHPRFSFWAFSAILLALFVTSGLVFRSGGLHRLQPRQTASPGLELEHVALVPYVSQQGRFFWLVKADVQSSDEAVANRALEIHLSDNATATVVPGAALDPLKLYVHGLPTALAAPAALSNDSPRPLIAAIMPRNTTVPSLSDLQINRSSTTPNH